MLIWLRRKWVEGEGGRTVVREEERGRRIRGKPWSIFRSEASLCPSKRGRGGNLYSPFSTQCFRMRKGEWGNQIEPVGPL